MPSYRTSRPSPLTSPTTSASYCSRSAPSRPGSPTSATPTFARAWPPRSGPPVLRSHRPFTRRLSPCRAPSKSKSRLTQVLPDSSPYGTTDSCHTALSRSRQRRTVVSASVRPRSGCQGPRPDAVRARTQGANGQLVLTHFPPWLLGARLDQSRGSINVPVDRLARNAGRVSQRSASSCPCPLGGTHAHPWPGPPAGASTYG